MTLRLRALALIVTALALAGCTSTITGHGTLAGDSGPVDPTDPATDPPDPPTDPATEPPPDDPTADPGGGGNGTVTRAPGAETNPVCQIFSDEDIAAVFSEPVTVDAFVGDSSCQFKVADGGFVIVSHWEFLSPNDLAESAFDDTSETTFAGRPALRGDNEIIVALGADLAAPGAVDGSEVLTDTDQTGDLPVLSPLLEQAVDEFAGP